MQPPPSAMAKKKGKNYNRNHQSSVSFFDESFAVTDLVMPSRPPVVVAPERNNNSSSSSGGNGGGNGGGKVAAKPPPKPAAAKPPSPPSPSQSAGQSPAQQAAANNNINNNKASGKAPARIPRDSIRSKSSFMEEANKSPTRPPTRTRSPTRARSPTRTGSPTNKKRATSPPPTTTNNNHSHSSHSTLQSTNTKNTPIPIPATSTATVETSNKATAKAKSPASSSTTTTTAATTTKIHPNNKTTIVRPVPIPLVVNNNNNNENDNSNSINILNNSSQASIDAFGNNTKSNNNNNNNNSSNRNNNSRSSLNGSGRLNSSQTAMAAQGVVNKIRLILQDKDNDADFVSTDGDSTMVTNSDSGGRRGSKSMSITDDDDDDEDSSSDGNNTSKQGSIRSSSNNNNSNKNNPDESNQRSASSLHSKSHVIALDVDTLEKEEVEWEDEEDPYSKIKSHNSSLSSLHDSRSLVQKPLVQVAEEDEETASAPEQSMADGSKRSKAHSEDGTASLGSFRSMRSSQKSHPAAASTSSTPMHRSTTPEMDRIHPSLIEAATLEKQQHEDELDDDLIAMAFGKETKNRCEAFWPCLLCVILLGFWGGCIPYLIIRNNNLENAPTPLTPPPAMAPVNTMIPWTPAPTATPNTLSPTASPTSMHDNQELLDVLGSDLDLEDNTVPPTTLAPTNATNTNTSAPVAMTRPPNVTAIPATPAPTNETTIVIIPTEDPSIETTIIPSIDVSASIMPSDMPSSPPSTRAPTTPRPTPSPTLPPTLGPTPTLPTTVSPTVSSVPSSMPSFPPTGEPDVVFPQYSLDSFNDPTSAQSKAFSWMLRDPNFGSFNPSRVRQRFALATLYYSTNGDDWWAGNYTTGQTAVRGGLLPWLSYMDHECDWFHQRISDALPSVSRVGSDLLALYAYSTSSSGLVVCDNEVNPNGVFRGIRRLWLEGVGLEGTLPPELAMLTGLQELHINHNKGLVGPLPPSWFLSDKETDESWQSTLKKLQLKNCSLTGTIPTEISLATTLEVLDLQQNFFRGSIPSEVGLMSNLQDLLVNDNALTGAIPSDLGALTSALRACSFTKNLLTGKIPSEIMFLGALEEFYVGENQLSGSIPWQFGELHETLLDLHLYSNRFNGEIPSMIGLLTNLRWLHVGNNQLSGRLPAELGQMTMMQLFQAENNDLGGPIPSEALAAWSIAARVWLQGNPLLSGTIPPTWCGKSPDGSVPLKNGTVLALGTAVSKKAHSVDIRVDCNSTLECPCSLGCSCL